ncbi:hypothetical protein E0I61_08230, partial [Flavobacterium ranwuense]
MKKFIFSTIKSVQDYCRTFSWRFNAGFSKFNFTALLNRLSRLSLNYWRQSLALPLMLVAILMTGYTVNAQNIQGVAPVSPPLNVGGTAGHAIDGDAFAHEPIGTMYEFVGDLFDKLHPTIAGHGLINPFTGEVFYKPTATVTVPVTYQLKDAYQNDPTIFTSSNKINDNPNTYTWGAGSSPPKNEIQNTGAHFSYGDPGVTGGVSIDGLTFVSGTSGPGVATDLWALFAGDRQVTNGSSYIDFEFLQAPLTITGATFGAVDPTTGVAPITGGSGGFTTLGTQGGRTVGDVLVTIEFTQGGGDATVVIRKWEAIAGGGYEYVVHPNSEFLGEIYITNNFSTTTVPFDTYGTFPGVYAPNQWAEGAINLTQVFAANSNPCFTLSTLFIRTRSSGNSTQSELKDFPGAPVQLNLDFTPNANAGADKVLTCTTTSIALSGSSTTSGGTFSWVASNGGNIVSGANTATPIVNATGTYTLTVTSAANRCTATDVALVTLNNTPPNANAGADKVLTCTITSIALSGSSTTAGATFSWVASLGGNIVSGATTATPTVNAAGTYTLTVTDPVNGCTATDVALVTLDANTPNANAGADKVLTCTITSIALSGSS